MGVNASVVGLLLATLYAPVWSSGVSSVADIAWVSGGLLIMRWQKLAVHWMVLSFSLIGILGY